MDFRQSTQPNSNRPAVGGPAPAVSHKEAQSKKGQPGKWMSILSLVVLFGIAILIAAIAVVFTRSDTGNEFQYVNKDKYQAVFLNNGQVYFGNIKGLNSDSVRLTNIFYLTQTASTSKTTDNSNYSLVKLGCQQIHDPEDQMVINRDQVTFWENLQDSGKVVSSIKQFQKQNPNGPDCSQVSNQTQATSDANAQGSGNTNTNSNTNSDKSKQ